MQPHGDWLGIVLFLHFRSFALVLQLQMSCTNSHNKIHTAQKHAWRWHRPSVLEAARQGSNQAPMGCIESRLCSSYTVTVLGVLNVGYQNAGT